MRYTFWASDCLHDFKKVLKKKDSYETRWASLFEQSLDLGLLKSFVAWWSGNTNTTMTCYGDLGIFLWDVYCNSWLPIIGEMHDESFPGAISYRAEIYEYILNFPGFWDTYIPGSPNPSSLKRLRSLCSTWWPSAAQGTGFFEEDFKDWGCSATRAIDGESYLAYFLGCWPNGRVLADPFTSICLETFLTSVTIAPRTQCSLAVPYLAWGIGL